MDLTGGTPPPRCDWGDPDPLLVEYHDREWGVPVRDDRRLLELLVLGGAQAGVSFRIVLHRRKGYRAAFAGFDPAIIVTYDAAKIEALLQDPGILRNRQKVNSAVRNARAFVEIQQEFGSFADYLWGLVDGAPVMNQWRTWRDVPAITPQAEALSRDLIKRGFSFMGPTICYAFMQSAGLVNDHIISCFRYPEIASKS